MGVTVLVTDRCTGHGACYTHCPEVFSPDEEGYAVVDESAVEANVDQVRYAVMVCPERAIELVES